MAKAIVLILREGSDRVFADGLPFPHVLSATS
jgi:hypothetical protein